MSDFVKNNFSKRGKLILVSTIIGVAVTLVMMLLLSAVMLFLEADSSLAVPFATVSVAAGAFAAAFYAARKIGSRGYLTGLICGIATFLIVMLLSLMISKDSIGYNTLFHFIIIVISSLIGGILGINFRRDRKYI